MSQNSPTGGNAPNRFTSPPNLSGGTTGTPQTQSSAASASNTTATPSVGVGSRFPAPGGATPQPLTVSASVASPSVVPLATSGGMTTGTSGSVGTQLSLHYSLLARAMRNDPQAIADLFGHFVPIQEPIIAVAYLGQHGIWWSGKQSFCCLTERRIASLVVGKFGEIVYQDGYIEHINSGIVYQPSRLALYIQTALWLVMPAMATTSTLSSIIGAWAILVGMLTLAICGLLLPLIVNLYYKFNKCGLVFVIREGVSVYMFTNRNRLSLANDVYRAYTDLRDRRLSLFGHP